MGFFTKKEVTEKRDMTIENSGIGADIMYAKLYGGTVDAELAMQIPSVARSVNMIASAVAMLPVKMYRKNGAEVEEITDDPRIRMLNSVTGDTISADEMRFSMVRDFLLKGSAYAFIGREYGKPEKLFYIPEKYICVMKNEADIIHKRFNYSIQGKPYYPYQLLKVLKGTDGFGRGKGIVQENPMILDTAYQMMKFQKNQLIKGGNKKGFLKAEKTLAQKAIDEVKSAWAKLYSNENTESMVFLNNGVDFKEISSTSVEMQINQNMTAANAELMKLFGTSDGILSDDTVKNAVMPVIDAFEAAYDNDLLLESERGAVYFAFDTRELTRGNIQQRYSAYATALQQNFLQLDEVRAMEDLPPLGVNFIRLGLQDVLLDPKTGKIYTPNTNAMVDMGSGAGSQEIEVDKEQKSGIIDVRGNPNHDPNTGRFTSGSSSTIKSELQAKIDSGEISTKLDKDKQGRHIIGNPSFEKRVADGEFPSYITVSKMEIQNIINSKMLTGNIQKMPDGQFRELITADDYFGVACSLVTGKKKKTNRGVIHYSKSGTHLVPTWPEESNDG